MKQAPRVTYEGQTFDEFGQFLEFLWRRENLTKAALADENVQKHIEGKTVRKVIVVPGRLVNIVAN